VNTPQRFAMFAKSFVPFFQKKFTEQRKAEDEHLLRLKGTAWADSSRTAYFNIENKPDPWFHGFIVMVWWFDGFMVWWFHGLMAWWFHGLMVLWFDGSMVWWFHGLMASWFDGFMVPWFDGLMVPWFDGLMVPWFDGSMVWWFHGLMVPWFDGFMVWWLHVSMDWVYSTWFYGHDRLAKRQLVLQLTLIDTFTNDSKSNKRITIDESSFQPDWSVYQGVENVSVNKAPTCKRAWRRKKKTLFYE
jgi:hypothetical protein